jgi:hypothetical protein
VSGAERRGGGCRRAREAGYPSGAVPVGCRPAVSWHTGTVGRIMNDNLHNYEFIKTEENYF